MISICLKAVIAVAAAHWLTAGAGALLGMNLASGITAAAMQQGGIGLLLTLLIITIPPMAAGFFQGTLGQFSSYGQVAGGGTAAAAGNQQSRYESAQSNVQKTQQREVNNTTGNLGGGVQGGAPSGGGTNQSLTGATPQSIGAQNDVVKTAPSTNPSSTMPLMAQNTNVTSNQRGKNTDPGGIA